MAFWDRVDKGEHDETIFQPPHKSTRSPRSAYIRGKDNKRLFSLQQGSIPEKTFNIMIYIAQETD